MWPSRETAALQPETRGKGLSFRGVFSVNRAAATPAALRPAPGHLALALPHRGRAVGSWFSVLRLSNGAAPEQKDGSTKEAWQCPPCPTQPPWAPGAGSPQGPLAGMTAPEGPTGSRFRENPSGRGPRGDSALRARPTGTRPQKGRSRLQDNWTLQFASAPRAGPSRHQQSNVVLRSPFHALLAKEP